MGGSAVGKGSGETHESMMYMYVLMKRVITPKPKRPAAQIGDQMEMWA